MSQPMHAGNKKGTNLACEASEAISFKPVITGLITYLTMNVIHTWLIKTAKLKRDIFFWQRVGVDLIK